MHRRKIDGQIFYVGIGSSTKRPYSFSDRNPYWKKFVGKYGLPDVQVIENGVSEEDAKELEVFLISEIRRRKDGGTLVNITLGGDDQPMRNPDVVEKVRKAMLGREFSQETKQKMSTAAKCRGVSPAARVAYRKLLETGWRPMQSEESRRKMSESQRGKKLSAEHCRKNGEAHSHAVFQIGLDGTVIAKHASMRAAAAVVGCTGSMIGMCCKGATKTAKGFIWVREVDFTVITGGESIDPASLLLKIEAWKHKNC